MNSEPSIWGSIKEGPQLIYSHTSPVNLNFSSSVYHLIALKQTLYITAETQMVDTEVPGEQKVNEVIKFYFKDLKLTKNICEIQTDKLGYNIAFMAHD